MNGDQILTILVLSLWFLFPLGMFLSVSHVEKNTDQIIQLDKLRHHSAEEVVKKRNFLRYFHFLRPRPRA